MDPQPVNKTGAYRDLMKCNVGVVLLQKHQLVHWTAGHKESATLNTNKEQL